MDRGRREQRSLRLTLADSCGVSMAAGGAALTTTSGGRAADEVMGSRCAALERTGCSSALWLAEEGVASLPDIGLALVCDFSDRDLTTRVI